MSRRVLFLAAFMLGCYHIAFAQRITESLAGWTLGTNQPKIKSGLRSDGSSGNYIYCPVGTNSFCYGVPVEGTGRVTFWIYDPVKCLSDTNPGFPQNGPKWGLIAPIMQVVSVGVHRNTACGCLSYCGWSSVSPYSYDFIGRMLRSNGNGANNHTCVCNWCNEEMDCNDRLWTPGWYKWTIDGGIDNITFTVYDCIDCFFFTGSIAIKDVSRTYDATSIGVDWAAMFGFGWSGFWAKGDDVGGIEDIGIDVVSGTGVFEVFGTETGARPYQNSTWGNIKSLYK
jgi:hypothetical protein